MVSHPENGSDSPIGSNRDRGRDKDAFPSDTKKNPKDCMAVQLRSGKELEKEKSEKDEGNKREGCLENAESLEKERKKE